MIRFTKVSKQYPRGGPALEDVSFSLRRGEFAFLTGPSGAGKSTILKLIYVAERPTSGEVRVDGKSSVTLSRREIPQLRHLSQHLGRLSEMHLVPAEGPIPYRTFYSYIANRGFPVTQFIRHGSRPEFTPEPDMIHDCLGHVPPLVNHDYAELLTLIGKAAVSVPTGEQVLALKRLSWFSIEFGLIQEDGVTKVYGAGILSSSSEIPFSLSDDVDRRRWKTEEVIATDYDPSRMQSVLFVVPSFAFLRFEVEQLVQRLGLELPHETH